AVENATEPPYWTKMDLSGASYDIAFSPDNRTLARCGADGIKLYNMPLPNSPIIVSNSYRDIAAPDPKRLYKKIRYSNDGKALFAGCGDGQIFVFNADNGDR